MNFIEQQDVICEHITSYNVPLDEPLWNVATTYAKDDLVVNSACGAVVYKSIISNNTGNAPDEVGGTSWVAVGASNHFAMFDRVNQTQTVFDGEIVLDVDISTLTNSVALINIEATYARFEAWDTDGTTKILDIEVSLRDYGATNMYDYYFSPILQKTNFVSFELPLLLAGSTGRLTINNGVSPVKIGSLVWGQGVFVGESLYGLSIGIKDYTSKTVDTFGNTTVIERGFSDTIEDTVKVDNVKYNYIKNMLTKNRAKPLVWASNPDDPATIVYGYYQSFSITLPTPAYALCRLKIEGLT